MICISQQSVSRSLCYNLVSDQWDESQICGKFHANKCWNTVCPWSAKKETVLQFISVTHVCSTGNMRNNVIKYINKDSVTECLVISCMEETKKTTELYSSVVLVLSADNDRTEKSTLLPRNFLYNRFFYCSTNVYLLLWRHQTFPKFLNLFCEEVTYFQHLSCNILFQGKYDFCPPISNSV